MFPASYLELRLAVSCSECLHWQFVVPSDGIQLSSSGVTALESYKITHVGRSTVVRFFYLDVPSYLQLLIAFIFWPNSFSLASSCMVSIFLSLSPHVYFLMTLSLSFCCPGFLDPFPQPCYWINSNERVWTMSVSVILFFSTVSLLHILRKLSKKYTCTMREERRVLTWGLWMNYCICFTLNHYSVLTQRTVVQQDYP